VGRFALVYLGVEIVSDLGDTQAEVFSHGGEGLAQQFAGSRDHFLDGVGVVDLFLLQLWIVLLDQFADVGAFHGGVVIQQFGGVGEYLIEVVYFW
jgi:hypothetical protein